MPISLPNTTITIARQPGLTQIAEQRILVIGQKTAGGSATGGALVQDVSESSAEIASLFGARSHIAQVLRAIKLVNKLTAVDAIALADNGSAVSATAQVTFTGTATESGRIFVEVGSGRRFRFPVDVVTGDTGAGVAVKLLAEVNLATDAPFTGTQTTVDVDLTAANGGTWANDLTLRVDGTIGGISTTLTGWASGANDPSLTSLFAVIGSRRYQTIIWPSAYVTTVLETLLDARFNTDNDVLDGRAIITAVGTAGQIKTIASGLDSPSFVVFADKATSAADRVGTAMREMPDVVSAMFGAVRALRLTENASLASVITTPAPLDQFGGAALASLPLFNSILSELAVTLPVDEWTNTEVLDFNANGVSVIGPNRAFSSMIAGEVVTTNTTDGAGNDDLSFKFLNTVDTMSLIREVYFTRLKSQFSQARLTGGDLVAGRSMANEPLIRAFFKEIYQELAELTLVQAGSSAIRDFNQHLILIIDLSEGKVTFAMAPLLVTGLRVIIGTISVNFGS
jgi:phage tail sheath gpL-like